MTELSYFQSRPGKMTCTAEEFYTFATDIRNFERFIPEKSITNWHADKESCSFSIRMLGNISVRLSEQEQYTKVVFTGDALKKDDFILTLDVTDNHDLPADIRIILSADLNPMMKLMAGNQITLFLDKLVTEIEEFNGWTDIKG